MSFNKEESLFWLLANKYSVIPVPLTENVAKLNETEVPVKVNSLFALLNIFRLTSPTYDPATFFISLFDKWLVTLFSVEGYDQAFY
jgi:hypothetical protein